MDECTVLMTGCGAPGAPGIIRCLRKNGERNIRIVSVDRNENAGSRDLVDAFYTVPSAEKEDFIPAVLDICRREGVQVALRDAGLDGYQLPRICCNAFTVEEGQRCMQELLTRCPFLDGVVCVTDTVAFGAMHALKQAGRQIGRDVGLAGIGDSWAGSVTDPGLATVRFYQKQVGQEAARILLQMLEEKEYGGPVRQVTLGYQVVERGSL